MAKSISTALVARIFSECPICLPMLEFPRDEVADALIQVFEAEYLHVLRDTLCDGQQLLDKDHATAKQKSDLGRPSLHWRVAREHTSSWDMVLLVRNG